MMEVIFFLLWFLPTLLTLTGCALYLPARDEWNKTIARAAVVARSNLGSRKAKEVLAKEKLALNPYTGPDGDEEAKKIWESQFTGQELVLINKDAHQITESYNKLTQTPYDEHPVERWFWVCSCGENESRKTKDAAKNSAKRHLTTYAGRNADLVRDQGWLRL